MSGDLSKDLQTAYDLAVLRSLAHHIQTGPQWRAVRDIQEQHQAKRSEELHDYEKNYDRRLTAARQDIIAKRGQPRHEPKKPAAVDRFSAASIERQAHRVVRADHHSNMSAINESERDALQDLVEKAQVSPTRSLRPQFSATLSAGQRPKHKQ